jgi:hypothetical protein
LEEQIDDRLSLAKHRDREGLDSVNYTVCSPPTVAKATATGYARDGQERVLSRISAHA